jgi:hypothetical protein
MRAKVRGAERAREERSADLDRRASMFWMLHEAALPQNACVPLDRVILPPNRRASVPRLFSHSSVCP